MPMVVSVGLCLTYANPSQLPHYLPAPHPLTTSPLAYPALIYALHSDKMHNMVSMTLFENSKYFQDEVLGRHSYSLNEHSAVLGTMMMQLVGKD